MLRNRRLVMMAMTLAMACAPVSGGAQSGCIQDRYGNVLCGPAGSHCVKDHLGEVKCSPPDGGILLDRYRSPVCGPGRCIANRVGEVVCSSVSKGAAALNGNGDPVCTEGCVPASAQACTTPTK